MHLIQLAPLGVTALLLVALMLTRCAPALRRRDGAACSMCVAIALITLWLAGLACGMPPRIALLNAAVSTLVLAVGTLVLGWNRRRGIMEVPLRHGRRRSDPPRSDSGPHAPSAVARHRSRVSAETRGAVGATDPAQRSQHVSTETPGDVESAVPAPPG